ncbi:MAG: glycosyltransferase family 25 protein [Rhizobiaceae bacterium]|nr:glycosyltransferase family 25 protein [Rhizobiaceae bacterium]
MWHSYLINLDKNHARLENSRRQFKAEKIAFSRINAVNGWELSDEEIARVYNADMATRRYKYPLVKPEIGCYLSHIEAWRQIAESGEEGGFIFEDDFQITSPLAPVLEALSVSTEDWDMAKMFSLKKHPKIIHETSLTPFNDLTVPYQVPTCLLAYALRAETAKKLVEISIPFFRPVDEDHKFYWEKNLRVTLVHPSPVKVGDQQTKTGTIGDARRATPRHSLPSRLRRLWRNMTYQLKYKSALHYHRMIGIFR